MTLGGLFTVVFVETEDENNWREKQEGGRTGFCERKRWRQKVGNGKSDYLRMKMINPLV